MAERGASVVLLSRFTPGLRLPAYLAAGILRARFWRFTAYVPAADLLLPTYLAAGILRARFWTFNAYFLAAALIWTPLLVGSAAFFGRIFPAAPYAIGVAMVLWHARHRLARYTRWEFWPPWLAYLPVLP